MAANVTSTLWSLEDLTVAALAEPEGEKPEPKPLVIPKPDGTARELPNERGFLRVVGGKGAPSAPSPAPPVSPTPAVATASAPAGNVEPKGQLDLLSWRPKPRDPVQLGLFGDE